MNMTGYKIYAGDTLIGESGLETEKVIRYGSFYPAPGYETVRAIFQKYGRATIDETKRDEASIAKYWDEQRQLGLKVLDPNGVRIVCGDIHIYDYTFDSDVGEQYQIEIYPPKV